MVAACTWSESPLRNLVALLSLKWNRWVGAAALRTGSNRHSRSNRLCRVIWTQHCSELPEAKDFRMSETELFSKTKRVVCPLNLLVTIRNMSFRLPVCPGLALGAL